MKKIISSLLILTFLFSLFAVTASAAREEQFISEVALVYEDSVENAKKAIEGTDWKLLEYDLNANADYWFDDGVYLIYKTSSDVEDAITDLRVMDMYGGYTSSNYEKTLEASRAEYTKMVEEIRTVAAEFKALYESGDKMAHLAYRQMNYYKDKKTQGGSETDMLMGDFLLNMPEDDKRVVQVLFEGNKIIISNLITLLAVGISGENENDTLSARIAEKYAIKHTLTAEEYHEAAVTLDAAFGEIRSKLIRYDNLSESYDFDDDTLTDEEINFIAEYAGTAVLLENIMIGDMNLADAIRSGTCTMQDLYCIAAALTEGQKALVRLGQLESVLKYNAPTKSIDELNSVVEATEAGLKDENGNIKHIDVYIGVDRSIFKGTFAMTDAASREQALTGGTWDTRSALVDSIPFYIATVLVHAGIDAAMTYVTAGINAKLLPLMSSYMQAQTQVNFTAGTTLMDLMEGTVANAAEAKYIAAATKYAPVLKAVKAVSLAAALILIGANGISVWYNYYNPDYTPIPDVMIDVRETDLGDKYVKYNAAKVFGDDENKNADFNAYEGKEWNALYYTKDATAGNSLTPNFAFSESSNLVARRYQGVSMFGETNAFDLNSHVYDEEANGAYLTVRYSTTKKAAADMPAVVGSVFATGALYALTAIGGAGVGIGGTLLVQSGKKKKDESESSEGVPESD